MQHDLKGAGAVVTGAASGIGEAIATAFIEPGTLLCDLSAKTRPSHFEAEAQPAALVALPSPEAAP